MIRKYIFSEELGRNIIWVMLSGFFLRIGAKENLLGKIIMPKNHYLFNLDEKQINDEYLNYDNLHYILLDGSTEYLQDKRLRNIKKKVNIYYVGKLDNFWKDIENAEPLFPDNLEEFKFILSFKIDPLFHIEIKNMIQIIISIWIRYKRAFIFCRRCLSNARIYFTPQS